MELVRATGGVEASLLLEHYRRVRAATLELCTNLSAEDMVVQFVAEASPAKWHLAHTTWFFETFVLGRRAEFEQPYSAKFGLLFNSYYHSLGERHPRPRRGLLTRPSLGEVLAYRDFVDEQVARLLAAGGAGPVGSLGPALYLGLAHEQQHQELLLTDIKLLFHENPLQPSFAETPRPTDPGPAEELRWVEHAGGLVAVGHDPANGFAFDNELPPHRVWLEPFALASRPATNGELLAFVEEGGYENPLLWLDEGWAVVCRDEWRAPFTWRREADGSWSEFTLHGRRTVEPARTATHLSFFEAEAFARWSNARLPTEAEWEHAARPHWNVAEQVGNFLDHDVLAPRVARTTVGPFAQLAGDVWEWTRSVHEPYPGYVPPGGAIGEYNGKFMSGTFVLRGGSCATPAGHVRSSYRNFFAPASRWQFSGVRLARD